MIPTAERNKVIYGRADEEHRISALLRPAHGQYMAKYDVLRPRDEIQRSSSARRDTTLFRPAVDMQL